MCPVASAQRRKQERAKDEADRRQLLAQQQLERMRINKQRRRENAEMFARGGDSGVNLPFFAGGQCFATNTLHTLLCQVRRRNVMCCSAGGTVQFRNDACARARVSACACSRSMTPTRSSLPRRCWTRLCTTPCYYRTWYPSRCR